MHRMVWPALSVQNDCEIALGQALEMAQQTGQSPLPLIQQEVANIKPNVIVFQRPMASPLVQLIRQLQRTGYAIVIDVDDDFTCLDPTNPAFDGTDPAKNPIENRDNHWLACGFADLLTVSTPNIFANYGNDPERIRVIRNRVPEHWLNVKVPKDDPMSVVWTGVLAYHGGDIEVADGQIGVACSGKAKFRNIGGSDCADIANARGNYQQQPFYNLTTMQYTQALARCSVGVVPLVDREFNRSKSWIKGLEYSAFGIPFVASPLPEYQVLTDMGAGELADHPKQWKDKLDRLLTDPEWRAERSEAGRDVAAGLTTKSYAPEWVEAWTHAAERAKQRMSA